jgi:stage III sporulation protein AH
MKEFLSRLKRFAEKGKTDEKGETAEGLENAAEAGETAADMSAGPEPLETFETLDKPKKARGRQVALLLRRKQITAVCLLLLIGAACYVNYTFQGNEVDEDVAAMYEEASKRLGEATMVNAPETPSAGEAASAAPSPSGSPAADAPAEKLAFAHERMNRDVSRSESIETLTQLLNNPATDAEAKGKAQARILALSEYANAENAIESLIRAKGFADALAMISEDAASVAVKTEGLNPVDAAVILDAAQQNARMPATQIKIVEVK